MKQCYLYIRWAVSSVMTRQNQIPTADGSRVTLALIPLWDMCNHTNGLVSLQRCFKMNTELPIKNHLWVAESFCNQVSLTIFL